MEHRDNEISHALHFTLVSPNESDRNGEDANVVDGLFAIARAINRLSDAVEGSYHQLTPKRDQRPPRTVSGPEAPTSP